MSTAGAFAAAFGLGTLQKWERGERHPSGAARLLLKVMQADMAAVVKALAPPRLKGRRAA
jgi:DNA-binding transcriptional regulator YiaG